MEFKLRGVQMARKVVLNLIVFGYVAFLFGSSSAFAVKEEPLEEVTDFTERHRISRLEQSVDSLENKLDRLEDKYKRLDREVQNIRIKI